MGNFLAKTNIELNMKPEAKEIRFEILKKEIIVQDNRIIVDADSFDDARVYLDAFRAVINYFKFEKINCIEDYELLKILSMPPFKSITDMNERISEGTKFCHMYKPISLNNDLIIRIRDMLDTANNFSTISLDRNYYYRIMKWFTFSLDEISMNPISMCVIARPETLFIRFWTLFEIAAIQHRKEITPPSNGNNHLSEQRVRHFIEKLLSKPPKELCVLYKIRNKAIHKGNYFNKIELNLPIIINYCHDTIKECLSVFKTCTTEEEIINERNNLINNFSSTLHRC